MLRAAVERVSGGPESTEHDAFRTARKMAEYTPVIDKYRTEWSGCSPEQKAVAVEEAQALEDLTPEHIAAAVAALEG